jgi:hypothetical protein
MENIETILARILKPIFDIDVNCINSEIVAEIENSVKNFWDFSNFCANLFINQPIIKRVINKISNLGDKFCKTYNTCGAIDATLYLKLYNISTTLLNFREDVIKLQQTKNQYDVDLYCFDLSKFSQQVLFISKVRKALKTPKIVEQIKNIPNGTFEECKMLKINMLNNLGVQKTKFLKRIKQFLETSTFYSEHIQQLKQLAK